MLDTMFLPQEQLDCVASNGKTLTAIVSQSGCKKQGCDANAAHEVHDPQVHSGSAQEHQVQSKERNSRCSSLAGLAEQHLAPLLEV